MNVQTFRGLLNARPFRAFRILMSSGQAFEVRRSEAAFLVRDATIVGIDVADDGIPEEFKICSYSQITAVEAGPNTGR